MINVRSNFKNLIRKNKRYIYDESKTENLFLQNMITQKRIGE